LHHNKNLEWQPNEFLVKEKEYQNILHKNEEYLQQYQDHNPQLLNQFDLFWHKHKYLLLQRYLECDLN